MRLLWTFYLLSWTRLCGVSPLIAVWLISLLRATPFFAPRPNLPSTPSDVVLCRPGDLGAALVGRTLLYWWPDDGWRRGIVTRRRRRMASLIFPLKW